VAVGTGVSVIVASGVGDDNPAASVILTNAVPAAEVTIKLISVVGAGFAAPGKAQPARVKIASKKHTDFLFIFNVFLQGFSV
jgi:hypothetical protein